jgi:hypothetical protein
MIDSPHAEPDYYAVLRVPPDASHAEIEQAYRDLAGKRLNARWRTERAARELALLNAAYGILGYPDRRADYDRRRAQAAARPGDERVADQPSAEDDPPPTYPRLQSGQHLPRIQLGRPTRGNPVDVVIIAVVVLLALVVASVLASRSIVDLSSVINLSETLGLATRRRAAATTGPSTPQVAADAKPSPAAATLTPVQPPAPPGALPTAVAEQRFAGSQVLVSNPRPARRSQLTVTLELVREGQRVPNANVYLTAHYLTVDERQPPGSSTVKTDENGVAAISFSVGDATPNYTVRVDVTALVEGQQVVFQTSFTPV